MIGSGAGMASAKDRELFYQWLKLANDLNTGNPNFTPYEIPAKAKE